MIGWKPFVCVSAVVLAASVTAAARAADPVTFTDVTEQVGLRQHLEGWVLAHGGAWGDATGNGLPDLYLGAFADRRLYGREDAPIPNPLFLNTPEGFVLSPERTVRLEGQRARTTMALFVDLDNDGDLDLVVGNNAGRARQRETCLFENLGDGRFRDATPDPLPWPTPWAVRNIGALDLNGDGLLDLLMTDGNYANWRSGGGRLLVLENQGGWRFDEAHARYGFPETGTAGLGMALADVNNDGVFDVFVADSNRLFLSAPDGRYHAWGENPFVKPRGEGHPCGAVFADLNGDDRLDLVLTVHGEPGEYHVYLNEGVTNGQPRFRCILEDTFPQRSPITGLSVRGAHIGAYDVDNDGLRDIITGVLCAGPAGNPQPLVLHNEGVRRGVPTFTAPPLERCMGYYAPAPMADYDRDGRVDVFLPTWFEQIPSYLFRNTTDGGHWLAVRVAGEGPGLNPMGVGAIVRLYEAGHAGEAERQIGRWDIALGNGYSSGEEALAHFGLGERERCDVVVQWGAHRVVQRDVDADQYITVRVRADGR